jgi:hypothetical protein
LQYPYSLLDVGVLLSVDVMKTKFKLEDVVLADGLCLPPEGRKQCKDLNEAAYQLALSVASDEAVERLKTKVGENLKQFFIKAQWNFFSD